jgi:hypothetical protein
MPILGYRVDIPDLLTVVIATRIVIVVLTELRVWYFKAAFRCISREVVRNPRTI